MRPVEAVIDEIVHVKCELRQIRTDREQALALLADQDGRLAKATARDKGLQQELETIIRHRVTHAAIPA